MVLFQITMLDDILTKQFEFVKFPKPTPKPKKTMYGYALYNGIKKALKSRQAIKDRIAKYKRVHPLGAKKKKSKHKLPSIKSLKLRADKVFSIFIRNRDNNKCSLCGSTTNIQCGHLIKRGKMSTRYNVWNCHALCSGCNYKDNFEPQHYISWFLHKEGEVAYLSLVELSKEIKQMKRQDFLDIIKKYENNPTTDTAK